MKMILSVCLLISLAFVPQDVTSFSVGVSASRRNTLSQADLEDTLALLQRERRRVRGRFGDFQDFSEGRSLTVDDVRNLLRETEGSELGFDDLADMYVDNVDPTWAVDGAFSDISPQISKVKPSRQEIEDIFSDNKNSRDQDKTDVTVVPENNNQEDELSYKSVTQRNLVKKSITNSGASIPQSSKRPKISSDSSQEDTALSLSTLTQEEFKALMKAVGKLKKQVESNEESTLLHSNDETPEEAHNTKDEMAIIQPASKEEVQALFAKSANPTEDIVEESVVEEEVQTPEGNKKVFETNSPSGGRRLTELDLPNGESEVIEESLPPASMDYKDSLSATENQLTDAIASQLEEDISEEAVKEELEAEAAEVEAAEEAAKLSKAMEDAESQFDVEEENEKVRKIEEKLAAAASRENAPIKPGRNNIEDFESMWMESPPFKQKRTAKRAAQMNNQGQMYPPNGLDLKDILSRYDIERLLDNANDEQGMSINNDDAETVAQEILDDENMKDALTELKDRLSKEDIAYGSPLTGGEFIDIEDNNGVEDPQETSEDPFTLGDSFENSATTEMKRTINKLTSFDKKRLEELAKALSLDTEEDDGGSSEDSTDDNNSNGFDVVGLPDDDSPIDEETPMDFDLEPATNINLVPAKDFHYPREITSLPRPLGQFVTKLVELEDELEKLKLFAKLADQENDVLTDALNEATLAQGPGTVSDKEFDALQQAILLEKEVQKLKTGDDIHEEDFIPRHFGNSAIKRGEPWRRKREYIPQTTAVDMPAYPVSSPQDLMANVIEQDDLERLLARAYARKEQELSLDDNNLDDGGVASIFLPNADECPAVRKYSTNCELADLYALPVDYEARALCNLHEMCYACGNSLAVPQSSCDQVYRVAAKTLCRNVKSCVLEAEVFLRTMKMKTRYVGHSQSSCRTTCAAQFLGMV